MRIAVECVIQVTKNVHLGFEESGFLALQGPEEKNRVMTLLTPNSLPVDDREGVDVASSESDSSRRPAGGKKTASKYSKRPQIFGGRGSAALRSQPRLS